MAPAERSDTLVLFFSRSGHTRMAAEAIARELGADIEQVYSDEYPRGVLGYLKAGWHAYKGRRAGFWTTGKNPSQYSLVVIGTPVWNGSLPPPLRSYLETNATQFPPALGFFVTCGGSGARRVFAQMRDLVGRKPMAMQVFKEGELSKDRYKAGLFRFTESLLPAARRKAG